MTELQEKCLEDCRKVVRRQLNDDVSGHDWFHVERVELMSEYIANSEPGVDPFHLSLTALLHDVDDRKISPETTATLGNATAFLDNYSDVVSEELKEKVLEDIRALPYSGGRTPDSIEGRIVQDADRIDALGAIGVARLFAFGGAHNIKLYDPDIPPTHKPGCDSTSINHFKEKILHLEDTMNTKKGKIIARQRTRYMQQFIDTLYRELKSGYIRIREGSEQM